MNINDRLYVEIHPLQGTHGPHPHPIADGGFDPAQVYKVLGMYNPSETSECYFVLANPQRQIWFIPQRHLLAFGLINSDALMLPLDAARALLGKGGTMPGDAEGRPVLPDRRPHDDHGDGNGHASGNGNGRSAAPGASLTPAEQWQPRTKKFS